MKAAVFYADKGLVTEDVPMPEPGPDQVLVQVIDINAHEYRRR